MNHDFTHGEIYELRLCADWDYFTNRFGLQATNFNEQLVYTDRKTLLYHLVWRTIYKPYSAMAVMYHRLDAAKEFLKDFYCLYDELPRFMQAQLRSRTKMRVEFENGCFISVGSNDCMVRGMTLSLFAIWDGIDSAKKSIVHDVVLPALQSTSSFITFYG